MVCHIEGNQRRAGASKCKEQKFCLGSTWDDHSSIFSICMCCALTTPALCVVAQNYSPVLVSISFLVLHFCCSGGL